MRHRGPQARARAALRAASRVAAAASLALIAGCSWFGESEKPPLPGERVSTRGFRVCLDP